MDPDKFNFREYESAAKTVAAIHKFYLTLFVYIVMVGYLHWLDLRDGIYNWAYWPTIGLVLVCHRYVAFSLERKTDSKRNVD